MEHIFIQWACIIAVIFVPGAHTQSLIGPSPTEKAVLIGETHSFTCRKDPEDAFGSISWDEAIGGGSRRTIFINEGKETSDSKYNNFAIDSQNLYDLVISTIAVGDEGTYVCRYPFVDTEINAVLTVEANYTSCDMTPKLDEIVTVTAEEVSNVTCTALGGRPVVEIEWFHEMVGGTRIPIASSLVSHTNTSNPDGTFNVVSTLQYTASQQYNGGTLTCVTGKQEAAASIGDSATLNVQYSPVITYLEYGSSEVVCKTDANPDVTEYVFILNGTDVRRDAVCSGNECRYNLPLSYDTDVRCNATNAVGTGTQEKRFGPDDVLPTTIPTTESPPTGATPGGNGGLSPGAVAAIAIVSVVVVTVVIVLLVYFLVIKKKKDIKPKNGGGTAMKSINGSGDKSKERPTPAPRNSKGDAHDGLEKKNHTTDNPENLVYADLDHRNSKPESKEVIRTEEPTQYADVKTFIV